jgi:hypothetical protein
MEALVTRRKNDVPRSMLRWYIPKIRTGQPQAKREVYSDMDSIPRANVSPGDRVKVYRNLNSGNWSVLKYQKGRGWIKAAGLNDILLQDVEFKVSEKGRQRAIRDGKRNVHAFAIGTVHRFGELRKATIIGASKISYNPFKAPTFVDQFGDSVHGAASVSFSTKHGVNGWGLVINAV